ALARYSKLIRYWVPSIDFDQDQLVDGLSMTARTSEMLSMLAIRGVPRFTEGVRYGFRCFGGMFMSRKPRRSASLISALRLAFRLWRNCCSIAATSSSMINVVRMD